jgi:DNA (cytosine-5)-methyltransferase 1
MTSLYAISVSCSWLMVAGLGEAPNRSGSARVIPICSSPADARGRVGARLRARYGAEPCRGMASGRETRSGPFAATPPLSGRVDCVTVSPSVTVSAAQPDRWASAVDLFSGAGGFSLGLAAAGVRVVLGSDVWAPAGNTYRQNLVDHEFLEADARDLKAADVEARFGDSTGPRVIVGGPPCQGFSSAGSRRAGDRRNTLVSLYASLAAQILPEVIVFENVEGFLTAEEGRFVLDLLDPLIEAGYHVSLRKVNVANFGVPQLRKRVIVIAALGRTPVPLTPSHRAFGAPGVWRIGGTLPGTSTIGEALSSLPSPASSAPGQPAHHFTGRISDEDKLRIHALKPGQTMRDLPEELWHDSYRRRANRRVSDGTPTERRGGAPAGLRRLVRDEPSKAITSAASREFIHPDEDRPLTLRECARVQTFPDAFEFVGNRGDIATMIGNAVPPRFAQSIAEAVVRTLAEPAQSLDTEGRLVCFQPTAAEGMSPALAKVVRTVESRYSSGAIISLPTSEQETLWS